MLEGLSFCHLCEEELELNTVSNMAYSTEEKIAASERRRQGHVPNKRAQIVEQHHDESCGGDLSTLAQSVKQESYFEEVGSSDSEPDLPAGLAKSLSGWCQQRAEIDEPSNLGANTFFACVSKEQRSTSHPTWVPTHSLHATSKKC